MASARIGLLIIRAYAQSGYIFRCELNSSDHRRKIGFQRSVTLAELNAVLGTVQAWLEEVVAEPGR